MSASTAQSLNRHREGLSIVKGGHRVDSAKAGAAISDLFDAMGVDLSAPDLRVAAMYAELMRPELNATTLPNEDGCDQLVLSKNIPFVSLCAHHPLAFSQVARVGYLPGKLIDPDRS